MSVFVATILRRAICEALYLVGLCCYDGCITSSRGFILFHNYCHFERFVFVFVQLVSIDGIPSMLCGQQENRLLWYMC